MWTIKLIPLIITISWIFHTENFIVYWKKLPCYKKSWYYLNGDYYCDIIFLFQNRQKRFPLRTTNSSSLSEYQKNNRIVSKKAQTLFHLTFKHSNIPIEIIDRFYFWSALQLNRITVLPSETVHFSFVSSQDEQAISHFSIIQNKFLRFYIFCFLSPVRCNLHHQCLYDHVHVKKPTLKFLMEQLRKFNKTIFCFDNDGLRIPWR